ncbi:MULTISPECIES: hypothetical protein [Aerococcus]|uniref:Uncharacterized protein n=2 Tax=Aerococcus TaxID=1375 RepID=A0A178HIM9_9LACT|nr:MULTISPECIES: hypothetical protein [Aerococcus]KAA9219682.1 hypothetical protein F6I39_03530 [Aerococcus loyolae]KAA9264178.1 hypothetical protein F6I19_07980 [Aerococcus loyolae]MCY3025522.1 hypothetical protein [Aerococcus loyolae]MCY3026532.1 hypothetical protein [Aerococcus loyolae]MCY3028360.1 hypothetical protein [Aerococcus loyolae]
MTLGSSKKKQVILKSQFGQYLELVKTINYDELAQAGISIAFNFKGINDEIAFYMVIHGYLTAFDSDRQKETLIRQANNYRLNNDVTVEDLDQFLEVVWDDYQVRMEASRNSENKSDNNIIARHGNNQKLWNHFMAENIPELENKRQRYLSSQEW